MTVAAQFPHEERGAHPSPASPQRRKEQTSAPHLVRRDTHARALGPMLVCSWVLWRRCSVNAFVGLLSFEYSIVRPMRNGSRLAIWLGRGSLVRVRSRTSGAGTPSIGCGVRLFVCGADWSYLGFCRTRGRVCTRCCAMSQVHMDFSSEEKRVEAAKLANEIPSVLESFTWPRLFGSDCVVLRSLVSVRFSTCACSSRL